MGGGLWGVVFLVLGFLCLWLAFTGRQSQVHDALFGHNAPGLGLG